MATSKLLVAALIIVLRTGALKAQQLANSDDTVVADKELLMEIKQNSKEMENLEYLADMIGPRVTGSEQMTKASRWARQVFQNYGLDNPHLEAWSIPHSWSRGMARGRITSPLEHKLTLASAAWAPGTEGTVCGPIVYIDAKNLGELAKYKGRLRGAIAIVQEPFPLPAPFEVPRPHAMAPAQPPPTPGTTVETVFGEEDSFANGRYSFLESEGVAGLILDSHKPYGLLNMDEADGKAFSIRKVPTAFITREDYGLIWRLLKRGTVQVELEMTNSFSSGPVEVFNTVAEIRGSEHPEEVVIMGAHLDSWDLGTGAIDNGAGSIVILEAARALQKLTLKPKRTIRFVLFSGEEEGVAEGSHAYVRAHQAELDRISGVLVIDSGSGPIETLGLQANYQVRPTMDYIVAPLRDLGLIELSMRTIYATDHVAFNDAGVPGFFCMQEPFDYGRIHHTQADTFDKAMKEGLVQSAQVAAVWAYNVAQWPEMLPRRPVTPHK